jgi:hypothetical protein
MRHRTISGLAAGDALFYQCFLFRGSIKLNRHALVVATSLKQDGSASWTEQAIGVQLHGIGMDLM